VFADTVLVNEFHTPNEGIAGTLVEVYNQTAGTLLFSDFTNAAGGFNIALTGVEAGHLLPVVADRMDPSMLRSEDPFWRDRALVELCAAVLRSFRQAGVTIVDHHAASRQFMDHLAEEKAQGRIVPGDWSSAARFRVSLAGFPPLV
jgi:hypothetical protein